VAADAGRARQLVKRDVAGKLVAQQLGDEPDARFAPARAAITSAAYDGLSFENVIEER
jgi:hypothetical protein